MKEALPTVVALLNQVVPLPFCVYEDVKIRRKICDHAGAPLGEDAVYMELDLNDIKESHRAALSLRDQLQRRAQGYLMAVTVASSFSLGMIGLLVKAKPVNGDFINVSIPARIMLLAALLSFFMSAVSALRVMGPSEVFDLWLRSHFPNDLEQKKVNYIRYIQLNEAYAMIYACHTRGSYISMRNGVVVLFLWLISLIAMPRILF